MSEQESTSLRLMTHEAVCAERYGNIMTRIGRIENLIWAAVGTICLAVFGLIMSIIVDRMRLPVDPLSITQPHKP